MPDLVDMAQLYETLDREAAIRRVVQRKQDQQHVVDGVVRCRDCGDPVQPERLAAMPDACRCTECQRDMEA